MTDRRKIHVFLASPGDLAVERRSFKDRIELLNLAVGDGSGVEFLPLGWEDTLASTGRRAQSVINAEIDRCEIFILAMHRRWGQEAPDAKPYSSYTEEEFHRALDRFTKTGTPEIFVFFKQVDAPSIGDPGEQLKKVLGFRRQLEESRQVLYHYFADSEGFEAEVDRHLRAYARGDLPKPGAKTEGIVLPLEYVERVEQAEAEAKALAARETAARKLAEAEAARADGLALSMAREAAEAAREGKLEVARQKFAKAASGTTNRSVLSLAIEFFHRTGDLVQAEELLEQWLALSGRDAETAETAAALGNLGRVYQIRGELEKAEEMYRKALAVDEKLGHLEGMATQYGNLGIVHRTRGSLEKAEEMYRKALAINEKLGRLDGRAYRHGNFQIIRLP